jgi:hypothetical protein
MSGYQTSLSALDMDMLWRISMALQNRLARLEKQHDKASKVNWKGKEFYLDFYRMLHKVYGDGSPFTMNADNLGTPAEEAAKWESDLERVYGVQ